MKTEVFKIFSQQTKDIMILFSFCLWRVNNLSVIVCLFLKVSKGFLRNVTVIIWNLCWHKFGGHVTSLCWPIDHMYMLAKGLWKEMTYVTFFKTPFLYDYLNIKQFSLSCTLPIFATSISIYTHTHTIQNSRITHTIAECFLEKVNSAYPSIMYVVTFLNR